MVHLHVSDVRGSSAFQKRRLVVLFDAGVAGLVSPFRLGFRFDPLFHYNIFINIFIIIIFYFIIFYITNIIIGFYIIYITNNRILINFRINNIIYPNNIIIIPNNIKFIFNFINKNYNELLLRLILLNL